MKPEKNAVTEIVEIDHCPTYENHVIYRLRTAGPF